MTEEARAVQYVESAGYSAHMLCAFGVIAVRSRKHGQWFSVMVDKEELDDFINEENEHAA